MKHHLLIDIQHQGKPHATDDRGANYNGIDEVQITQYAAGIMGMHVEATILAHGRYIERHDFANFIALENPDRMHVYLASHVNAGIGNRWGHGLIGYDARSANGRLYAGNIAAVLDSSGMFPTSALACSPKSKDGRARRMHATIAGIFDGPANICGICLEPFFIENFGSIGLDGVTHIAKLIAKTASEKPL